VKNQNIRDLLVLLVKLHQKKVSWHFIQDLVQVFRDKLCLLVSELDSMFQLEMQSQESSQKEYILHLDKKFKQVFYLVLSQFLLLIQLILLR